MDAQERHNRHLKSKAQAIFQQVERRTPDCNEVSTIKVSFYEHASAETINTFVKAFNECTLGTNAENAELETYRVGGGMPLDEDIFLDEVICN